MMEIQDLMELDLEAEAEQLVAAQLMEEETAAVLV
jgi:hypothetical protein